MKKYNFKLKFLQSFFCSFVSVTMFRVISRLASNWSTLSSAAKSSAHRHSTKWVASTMTASLAAAAMVSTSCPTPITMPEAPSAKFTATSSPQKKYKQKRPDRKLKTVVEPGIEPYAPSVSYTHNHAEKELLDKIWDEDLYAEKYPTIPLETVRQHYSPDVGDGTVWVTFKGGIYDVTSFMNHHPGSYSVSISTVYLHSLCICVFVGSDSLCALPLQLQPITHWLFSHFCDAPFMSSLLNTK